MDQAAHALLLIIVWGPIGGATAGLAYMLLDLLARGRRP